jgi:hypothetical protein
MHFAFSLAFKSNSKLTDLQKKKIWKKKSLPDPSKPGCTELGRPRSALVRAGDALKRPLCRACWSGPASAEPVRRNSDRRIRWGSMACSHRPPLDEFLLSETLARTGQPWGLT